MAFKFVLKLIERYCSKLTVRINGNMYQEEFFIGVDQADFRLRDIQYHFWAIQSINLSVY